MRVKLGDVCTVVSGSTPKTNVVEYWDGDLDWLTPAELTDESYIINKSSRKITELGAQKTGLKSFPKGTVILSSRAPIGKVAIAGKEMFCNQGFKNLICSNQISNHYLYWYLKGHTAYLDSLGRGATFREISKKIVENIEINLPSLNEQKKCSQLMEQCWRLLLQRKQELALLDDLTQARFVEMFGDPGIDDRDFKLEKLGDLSIKISDGVHSKPNYTNSGKPFLSVVNINKGKIDFDNCKYVSEEDYQHMIKATHPEEGDVLYTKVGATYGIPAYVDTIREFCLYVSVALIKPKHEAINSKFLALSMAQPYVKRQADKRVRGIGVPDLHLNQISEFKIIVPPREEQNRFVDFSNKIDKSKSQLLFHFLSQQSHPAEKSFSLHVFSTYNSSNHP